MFEAKDFENIIDELRPIGLLPSGGFTRLGYTETEDRMHEKYIEIAKRFGLNYDIDKMGNLFIFDGEKPEKYYLMGSHLDSVIDGGTYDGILGSVCALMMAKEIKDRNLNIPFVACVFRCEESASFSKATIGSMMMTGYLKDEDLKKLRNQEGVTLEEIFKKRNYEIETINPDEIIEFLEIHIEQGRVLEDAKIRLGIVTTIAGNSRRKIKITGMAEHSGATPMSLRKDALAAAAQLICGVENIGRIESANNSVATVGGIKNYPNVMNVVPGDCELLVDMRGIDPESIARMVNMLEALAEEISEEREIKIEIESMGDTAPVVLDTDMLKKFEDLAKANDYSHMIMHSGAGHDTMWMAKIVPSMLIFIPCVLGISHNRLEAIDSKDAAYSMDFVLNYLINNRA